MSFKVIHPASRLEWWLARSQLYGQSLVDSVVGEVWRLVGLSVSRVQWYGSGGGGRGWEKSEVLYVTTGGLFPDSFKQKAIACWMGDGRERETSINDKGAAHHGNRHTKKRLLRGERTERWRRRRGRGQTKGAQMSFNNHLIKVTSPLSPPSSATPPPPRL